MAISKDTILLYVTMVQNTALSKGILAAFVVAENRRRQLFERLQTIQNQSIKGVKLKDLDVDLIDERLEKNASAFLQSLFSANAADWIAIEYTGLSAQRHGAMMQILAQNLLPLVKGHDVQLIYDPKLCKASIISGVRKVFQSVHLAQKTADCYGLQVCRFLAAICAADPGEEGIQKLKETLQKELAWKKRFVLLEGTRLFLERSVPDGQVLLYRQLEAEYPSLFAKGHEQWIRKKLDASCLQTVLELARAGMEEEQLLKLSPARLARKEELLAQLEKSSRLFASDVDEKKIQAVWQQFAQNRLDALEAEDLIRPQAQKPALNQEQVEAFRQAVLDRIAMPKPEAGEEKGSVRQPKIHIYLGYYRQGWQREERTVFLIARNQERLERRLQGMKARQELPQDHRALEQIACDPAQAAGFVQELEPAACLWSSRATGFSRQLDELLCAICTLPAKAILHVPSLLAGEVKGWLISQNCFVNLVLEEEPGQPAMQAARACAAAAMVLEVSTDWKNRPPILELEPLIAQELHAHLSDEQCKVLSNPDFSLALTKRLALAFEKGLDARTVSYVYWSSGKEHRQKAVRKSLLNYLYPTKIQHYLDSVIDRLSMEEYDYISNPGMSLAKIQILTNAIDDGWNLRDLRCQTCCNMTVTTMEKNLLHVPEQSCSQVLPSLLFQLAPALLKQAELLEYANALAKKEHAGPAEKERIWKEAENAFMDFDLVLESDEVAKQVFYPILDKDM